MRTKIYLLGLSIGILFFSSQILALEAIVTTLHAPVLKKPTPSALIVQYLNRGDRVHIVDLSILEPDYIPIWDSLAQVAYINRRFIKVFLPSGASPSAASHSRNDPTDYRKNEVILDNDPIPHKQEGKIWYFFSGSLQD